MSDKEAKKALKGAKEAIKNQDYAAALVLCEVSGLEWDRWEEEGS